MGLPVEVNNLMLGSLGGYTVGRSLRFRSSASAYLNRTQTAGSQTTWTWSGWVKRGKLTTSQYLMQAGGSSGSGVTMSVIADDFQIETGNGTTQYYARTTAQYRDPSAWYHVVMVCNTTSATSTLTGTTSDRLQIWINGVQVTSFSASSIPTQNFAGYMNQNTVAANIGRWNGASPSYYYDGYLAEVNFIDGQALTPSSFGAYDTNGVWQPKKYTGTYGTNGFYLPFSNTTSTTTLVQDSSGNGNNWTPNNISLTSGTTYDSMIDSPTNSASSSNYAVLNPLTPVSGATLADANLSISATSAANRYGSIGVSSGKWYWEATIVTVGTSIIGIGFDLSDNADGSSYTYRFDGNKYQNTTASAYGASYTNGDIIGFALDLDGGTITFYKNGVSQGVAFSSLPSNVYYPRWRAANGSAAYNFGQRPFSYTPPSGFKALNTYNLPAPSIANGAQYFAATTYTGTGASNAISNAVNGTSFSPDFLWVKDRSRLANNILVDSVRGVNNLLRSESTNAEAAGSFISSLNSNGFTLSANTLSDAYYTNVSGDSFIGWQWKGGGTAVTNNSGTISSQVSANTSAGISILTYTGNGTAGATVGHGLGVAPNMTIIKSRVATGGATGWPVQHTSMPAANAMWLNLTDQSQANTAFNSAYATSSTFSIGSVLETNASGKTYVAYCFSAVRGYSAFGSYTGNGSTDGPFVFTNFRPRWLMLKTTGGTADHWVIRDTSRDTYNASTTSLYANLSNADDTPTNGQIDILSNGFKIRGTANQTNQNGIVYIYAAFAEVPYNFARAR